MGVNQRCACAQLASPSDARHFGLVQLQDLVTPITVQTARSGRVRMGRARRLAHVQYGVTNISSSVLFALLFGLLFLVMLVSGVCCILSIQAPLRFPSRKMPINKEY